MREIPPDRLPILPAERAGTGSCPEAQSDGVPCPDPACDCPSCGRARLMEPADDLDGIMMCDGLYPLG